MIAAWASTWAGSTRSSSLRPPQLRSAGSSRPLRCTSSGVPRSRLSAPRTLQLGAEPPAVANFLVNDFRVTDDAVPATLIDLAARNVVDIEQRVLASSTCAFGAEPAEPLNTYEQRVLDHLRARAVDGVVPAEALTTGPGQQSAGWRRRFANEVVSDAQRRGLSRDALGSPVFTMLLVAAAIPALLRVGAVRARGRRSRSRRGRRDRHVDPLEASPARDAGRSRRRLEVARRACRARRRTKCSRPIRR